MLKILVPVNGSECSLRAVDEAIRTARANGDAIIQLLNVQPLFHRHVARFLSNAQTESIRVTRARRALEVAQQRVEAAGLRCSIHMLRGQIVPSITTYATEAGVHQIVVGTSPVSIMRLKLRRSSRTCRSGAWPRSLAAQRPTAPAGGR